jgi:hypothetical protein
MLTIEDATQAHRAELSWRLCPEDAAELDAAGLTLGCIEGVPAQALTMDGRLVCLFGVESMKCDPMAGVPWMLCTDALAEVPRRAMADVSAQVVAVWRGEFARLSNLVHSENRRALRFLRFLGFTVHLQPAGPGGAFYLFTWSSGNV